MTAAHDITAAEALGHALLEQRLRAARDVVVDLEDRVKASREALLPRLPLSAKLKERAKGTRTATIAGIAFKATPVAGAEYGSFSVKNYVAAGGRLTKRMRDHLGNPPKGYVSWTVGDPPAEAPTPGADVAAAAVAVSVAATLAGE